MQRKYRQLLVVLAFCIGCFLSAGAQTSGGTIAGTVLDPSGALVANATITATGVDTGSTYDAVTTSAGTFHFPQMQLGRYNLKVTASGFKAQDVQGIQVTTGNVSPAEIRLATGLASESVIVNESAPVVETENSEVSNTVSTRQIIELPLSLGGPSAG